METNSISEQNPLGSEKISKLVYKIALPSMLAQFVSVLYSIVDRMYVGNIPEVGNLSLAGVGVCGPIVTMIGAFASWIGIGGTPLMGIALGDFGEQLCHALHDICRSRSYRGARPRADALSVRRERRHLSVC